MRLTLFADGASRGNPGPASYGAVVVSESGQILAELGEQLGVRTNNYAEYQAVIAGLRHIQDNFPGAEVAVRMDSKLVIEQLSGRWQIKHPELRELASEAFRVIRALKVDLKWVPREENHLADAAANRALDEGDFGNSQELKLSAIQPKSIRAPRQSEEPTVLVVIRHGHTAHTEANLISGSDGSDPSLSEAGFAEAEAASVAAERLLKRFGLPPITSVYHSPMLRTTQTASALANRVGVDLKPDARLREIGFGEWEGRSMAEMEISQAHEISSWRGSMATKPPGGESVSDLESRVVPVVQEAIRNHAGESVAIVAHMMPARAIARRLMGASDSMSWTIQFQPASVSIFRCFGENLVEVFTLNSCEHLPAN